MLATIVGISSFSTVQTIGSAEELTAIDSVIKNIDQLNADNATFLQDVANVREQYGQLTEEEQQQVSNYDKFLAFEVVAVQVMIDQLIEQSTTESILAAHVAYNALPAELASTIDTTLLEQAEQQWAAQVDVEIQKLKEQASLEDIAAMLDYYNDLPAEVQQHVKEIEVIQAFEARQQAEHEAAKKRAEPVVKLIDELSVYSSQWKITYAREAFEQLDQLAKSYVTNIDVLYNVESEVAYLALVRQAEIDAEKVDHLIGQLLSSADEADVILVRLSYEKLSLLAKTYVTRLDKLEQFENYFERINVAAIARLKEQAAAVEVEINRLSYKSPRSEINYVKSLYTKLSSKAKTYVTNYYLIERYETYASEEERKVALAKLQATTWDFRVLLLKRTAKKAELTAAWDHYKQLSNSAKSYVKKLPKLQRIEKIQAGISTSQEYLEDAKWGDSSMGNPPLYIADVETEALPANRGILSDRYGSYNATVEQSKIIRSGQLQMLLTASNNIEITIPMAELKKMDATEADVVLTLGQNRFELEITADYEPLNFNEFVEVKIPIKQIPWSKNAVFFRETADGDFIPTPAIIKNDKLIVKTKEPGTIIAYSGVNTYQDITKNQHRTYIEELARRGIVAGAIGKNYFPHEQITRADFSSKLARAMNLTSTNATKFTDVKGKVYAADIQALSEIGVIKGVTATTFAPDAPLTRQQAALMITRLLQYTNKENINHMMNGNYLIFKDAYKFSAEGKKAIALMNMLGIFSGREDGTFNPSGNLTRAQMAKVLYNVMESLELI